MDFRDFYYNIEFKVNKPIKDRFLAKVGDTKSRGFYVKFEEATDVTMTLYVQKRNKSILEQEAIKENGLFRIDLAPSILNEAGTINMELALKGSNDEVISSKTFSLHIEKRLGEG